MDLRPMQVLDRFAVRHPIRQLLGGGGCFAHGFFRFVFKSLLTLDDLSRPLTAFLLLLLRHC